MESSVQSQTRPTESAYRSSHIQNGDRIAAIREEMEYLNTIGKSFVAAIDRFQVHRALLAALQELYSFAACSILLKGEPFELSIIPCYPLGQAFLAAMIERIASAASVMDFPPVSVKELAITSYLDAPDELSITQEQDMIGGTEIGSFLNIPLTVENRIIGMLSLFDERVGTFDSELLKLTTMIADYAGVALENVRLRERETALWKQAEIGRQRLELIISSMAEGLLITNERGGITLLNLSAKHLLAQARVDLKQETPLRELAVSSNVSWLPRLVEIIDQALTGEIVMNQELIAGEADEFVSIVSHELRSPLTAIKGYTQHLIRRIDRRLRKTLQEHLQQGKAITTADLPESYDLRSLSIVQSQADHLERLVNDLLDLSRVQWGKLHLHFSSFYLVDVLRDSVRSAQASAEQHTVYLDIATQDTSIVADKMRLSQVIGNILDNAIKYSPHGGQVMVKLEKQNDEYLVSITDQGIGISPEYLDHIFERFYRVRNTASLQYSGIGLGLYVTKAIVEGHGGRIWVTNNEGLGCTFSFTVPATGRSD